MTNSATANVWLAARAPDVPLPLPPGKSYGNRMGGWGPYTVIDDDPDAPVLCGCPLCVQRMWEAAMPKGSA